MFTSQRGGKKKLTLTPTNCSCKITHDKRYAQATFVANNAMASVARSALNDRAYKYVVSCHNRQNVKHRFKNRPEILISFFFRSRLPSSNILCVQCIKKTMMLSLYNIVNDSYGYYVCVLCIVCVGDFINKQ